jgi:4-oxalocrotonate tautomerase
MLTQETRQTQETEQTSSCFLGYALCAFRFRKEIPMPIVQISMIQGRTPEKKEQLIKKVTEAIIEVLKVPADRVRIILNEVPKENIGIGGVPLSKTDPS